MTTDEILKCLRAFSSGPMANVAQHVARLHKERMEARDVAACLAEWLGLALSDLWRPPTGCEHTPQGLVQAAIDDTDDVPIVKWPKGDA